MKKLTIEELKNEVESLEIGQTIVVSSSEDIGLTTTISKVDFLDSEMLLAGGYCTPIQAYQIFEDDEWDAIERCVNDVISFFKEDFEDLKEVVIVRRGSNSLDFTV